MQCQSQLCKLSDWICPSGGGCEVIFTLNNDESPSCHEQVRQDCPDPDCNSYHYWLFSRIPKDFTHTEHHVDRTSTNGNGVNLGRRPPGCPIRILQSLQEQAEVVVAIRQEDSCNVQDGYEVDYPTLECTPVPSQLSVTGRKDGSGDHRTWQRPMSSSWALLYHGAPTAP